MKSPKIEYVGKDLEAMDFAENYHRWILDIFRPFLGNSLVEVGAGTGSFSNLLLDLSPVSLSLVEPSGMFDSLVSNLQNHPRAESINFVNSIFTEAAAEIKVNQRPDTIIYINVLEHIDNDADELKAVFETLPDGGRVCIFVPAMAALYSKFDKHIGHFRRYSMKELTAKCRDAGFNIVLNRNFDLLGILPWLIKYRMFGSIKMEPGAVALYDRVAVPLIRPVEALLHPPIGKNLLLVAEKPAQ